MSVVASETTSGFCGICSEAHPSSLVTTTCCGQFMCRQCVAANDAYNRKPTCPFCRQEDFELLGADTDIPSEFASKLNGMWDVQITEKSCVGTCKYDGIMTIDGDSAKFQSADNHLEGAKWEQVGIGRTISGKSFTAKQVFKNAPAWLGDGASVDCGDGLLGRIKSGNLDEATFSSSFIVDSAHGDDELEITVKGTMKRRSSPL